MNQISSDPAHKYFHPDFLWCTVYLNESLMEYAVNADVDEGWVETFYLDENKNFVVDPQNRDRMHLKRFTGTVRIEMRKPHAA